MDSRTRLAISGTATVVASAAVVCAVAVSTTVALADVAGAPLDGRVIVPASVARHAPLTPVAEAPEEPVTQTETVEAPEPKDVAPPSSTPSLPSAGQVTDAEEQDPAVDAARSASDADASAGTRDWDREQIDAWIAQREAMLTEQSPDGASLDTPSTESTDRHRSEQVSAPSADETSERHHSGWAFGSKREQSRVPPD